MPVVDIKGVGKAQFPDGMQVDDIRSFLRNKYYQDAVSGNSDILAKMPDTIAPYEPTLVEAAGAGVADFLKDTGLISNNYRAQDIGKNIATIGEFLPGIGDVAAADDFGRAYGADDYSGMALSALGVVPVAGDVAKKAIGGLENFAKFSDKTAARRAARLSVFDLPTKGSHENIKHVTDLFDYTPEQLVDQLKVLDPANMKVGGYLKQGDGLDIFYKNDGTSDMIDKKTGDVIFTNDVEQTGNLIKDDVIATAEGRLTKEQKAAQYQARKADRLAEKAREEAAQETYKMQHTAPMRGDNPSGDDLTQVYGDDIYTGNAVRYYGSGSDYDQKAVDIIQSMRGNPEKEITIYRAVPKEVKSINSSDWITTTKEYAQDHMEGEKGWHILSKKVKAKDIASDGNSLHEFGYDPAKAVLTKEVLKTKYPNLKIGISENKDSIILDKIIVPDKSKGTGTSFMNDLISDADSKGKTIGLTPSGDFGGSKARLIKFYKRFGFVENKGKNKDYTISETMIRPAQ